MLGQEKYGNSFSIMQSKLKKQTEKFVKEIRTGETEKIAKRLEKRLKHIGYTEHWYPIMVNAGRNTSKLFSRCIHLPSTDQVINDKDIIIIDSTPLKIRYGLISV